VIWLWFIFDVPEIFAFIVSVSQNLTVFLDDQDSSASLAYFFMHVTTYDFFYKLTNIDRYKHEPLPQFSLYGFVIYDPIEHVDFKKNLEENYKFLDQISGENFLFFSVIEWDEEKEVYFKGRPYLEAYQKLDQDYSGIKNPVIVKNQDTLAYTLAAHLEIDLQKLPVLVVSKDLAFGHKEVIPVTAENFWDKLSKLNYIATIGLKGKHDDDFRDLLIKHGVANQEDFNISSPSVKLNHALYNAMGCFEFANNHYAAQTHINYLITDLRTEITHFKNKDDRESLEKSLIKLASVLGTFSRKDDTTLAKPYDFVKEWQNSVTKMYLKSYGAIPKTIEFEDYSPLAINLAKSFEHEIVLSYYNWLRKENGIPMPEYYAKLLKGKEVKFDRYDLNRNVKGELVPLELGSAVLCLKKYFEENNVLPEHHKLEDFKGSGEYMLKLYLEINNIRNNICHPNHIFTKTDLADLENKINAVYNGPYGLKIRDLKNDLIK
jgi:hypothetical protein